MEFEGFACFDHGKCSRFCFQQDERPDCDGLRRPFSFLPARSVSSVFSDTSDQAVTESLDFCMV
jgi:hypothetical protein